MSMNSRTNGWLGSRRRPSQQVAHWVRWIVTRRPSVRFAVMGGRSRCRSWLLGRGLTPRPPDAAEAAVVCVTRGLDAAARVTFFRWAAEHNDRTLIALLNRP